MADPSAFVARAREVLAKATSGPLTSGQRSVYGLDHEFVANHANHRDKDLHVLAVNSLAALCDVVEAAVAARVAQAEYHRAKHVGFESEKEARAAWADADVALDAALARLSEVPRG